MLLFLLIFLLHYDVFICNGTNIAKFNESLLLDKLYQNLLHVNTVLKEVGQKKHNASKKLDKEIDYANIEDLRVLLKPKKDWNSKNQKNISAKFQLPPRFEHRSVQPTISALRQGFTRRFPPPLGPKNRPPLFVVPRPPSGYRMAIVPIKPGPRLRRPRFLLRPMRPKLLPDYQFQNVYLQPPRPHLPNHLYTPYTPRPKEFNQSFLDAELNSFHQELPQIFDPFQFPLPPPFPNPVESWISQAFTITTPSSRPNNDKGEKIWSSVVYNLYVPTHGIQTIVVTTTPNSSTSFKESTTRMSKINDYQSVTAPANLGQLFSEDEQGFLHVNVPQKDETTVPVPLYSDTLGSTTAGDVFFGKITVQQHPPAQSPTQRYLELVDRLDEGYLVVFMLEFCRLAAVKNKKDVRQALYHMETIYNHLWNNGRLAWIDEPLQTVIWKLVIVMSGGDIETVQTYASMMFHMLLRRRETLSPEVNSILEKADLFYNDAEGEELFKALMEFENYPNTTKSSYGLCHNLVESFLRPFRRGNEYRTHRRKKLLKLINDALKTRFPRVLTESGEVKPDAVFQIKKKKNRRPYPHKMMRKRKKHRIRKHTYGGQYHPNINFEISTLRSILPTREHARFRAMTTQDYRIKTTPHTARSYSFNKRNRKLTHQLTTQLQEKFDDNFVRNYDRSSKNALHHFVRKMSAAEHRISLKVTTPSTASVLFRSNYLDRNNDRSSKRTGHRHLFRKESDAKNRPYLTSRSNSHLKRHLKDKMHYYQSKKMSEKSESQKKKDKFRAELVRKISAHPTMD